jgi:hypothetical protein
MNNEIFLFCGGKRKYDNSYISKPLLLMNNGKSIIHNFLSLNINNFKKIHLLVEQNEISLYEKEVGLHKVDIVETPDKSPTIFKFKTVLDAFDVPLMSFSYPDIFTEKGFWTTPLCGAISLTTVPVRTRFPRVYTSPFETAVKGISSYDSRNPANAHSIFAGLFQGDRELFRDTLKNFESERIDGGLEVDFLNFCANKNILKQNEYYDFWLNADSSRDFDLIEERFSLV